MDTYTSCAAASRFRGRLQTTLVVILLGLALQAKPTLAARSMKADDVRDGYRAVLGTLATGNEALALEELFDFEVRVLGDKVTPARVDGYWKLKLGVIRDLLTSESPELLVPIVVLHHDAYLMYRDQERRTLAAHSRQMASELAEYYAGKAETAEAQRFAGWILTSFGAYLQDFWALSSSAEYFAKALMLDPGNMVARFRLAATLEKRGDYREAIEELEKALKLQPDNDQARLRLALCQLRAVEPFSDPEKARKSLRMVSEGSDAGWVRSIAFQELARSELELNNLTQAEAALRRGLELYPDDQHLALGLANLLDLDRRPKEAEEIALGVRADGWDRPSARYLYNRWPEAGIEQAREDLRSKISQMLPPLEAGLAGESGEAVGK